MVGTFAVAGAVQTPPAVPVVLVRESTDLTVANTTADTSIFSFSVPANAMGTDRVLLLQAWGAFLNNSGVAAALGWQVKFGGIQIFRDNGGTHASSANTQPKNILVFIGNQGATNGGFSGGQVVNAEALDTTIAQTIDITIAMGVANASTTFTRKYATLTLF